MSAVVCGSKRSFFEELPSSPSPIPISKKLRRCSPPPAAAAPRFPAPTLLDRLAAVFPRMEAQVLERALEECGNDIDAAIKRLHELCLGSVEENCGQAESSVAGIKQDTVPDVSDASGSEGPSVADNLPADGAGWVDLFVREMMSATSLDDARLRATRLLGILEQSISTRVRAQSEENFQKENMMLKEQIEVLIRENTILKRAVAIQHERQKEYDEKNRELQQLKQMVTQYQEQMRVLEVNNYALTMHLKQAEQSNSIPGRFHPDVF